MTSRAAVAWLIAVCLVWGVSFVAVKAALAFASPLVLLALRFAVAGTPIAGSLGAAPREEWIGGLVLGGSSGRASCSRRPDSGCCTMPSVASGRGV